MLFACFLEMLALHTTRGVLLCSLLDARHELTVPAERLLELLSQLSTGHLLFSRSHLLPSPPPPSLIRLDPLYTLQSPLEWLGGRQRLGDRYARSVLP